MRPRHRRGRFGDKHRRRQQNNLVQLGAAVLALVMLFLGWNQLADGAAGCFTRMAPPPEAVEVGGHDAARDARPPRHDAPVVTVRRTSADATSGSDVVD